MRDSEKIYVSRLKANQKKLARVISYLQRKYSLGDILADLLSADELHTCLQRSEIFRSFAQSKTQRDISDTHEIAIATISRGWRAYQVSSIKEGWGSIPK